MARILRHTIRSARWSGAPLRIAVVSDLHVIWPWTPLGHIARVVDQVTAEAPDLVLLPGDFLANLLIPGRAATAEEIARVLAGFTARLGVYATLGNHDWADCPVARASGYVENSVRNALAGGPVRLLENEATQIGAFWLAGIDSQQGEGRVYRPKHKHDLAAALAQVPDGADLILMAHEPDIWPQARPPAALTVSGHTHGGQIVLGNWRPLTPSRYGGRYAHGLHAEDGRHLVVSGGLGYSGIPLRIGVPPEITLITLSGEG